MKIADLTQNSDKSLTPFWHKELLNVTFYSLLLLVIVFFAAYPWKTNVASYMRQSNGPFVFFPVFACAAVIYSYLNVRCGKGEFILTDAYVETYNETAPPIVSTEEERSVWAYVLPMFAAHTLCLLLPALPIFLLATVISGLPFTACWAGIGIVFTLAFCARMIGLLILLLFGRGSMFAYFLSRASIALLFFATIFAGAAYNPLRCLYDLHAGLVARAWSWNDAYWRYIALITVSMFALALCCHIQQRRRHKQALPQHRPIPRRRDLSRR